MIRDINIHMVVFAQLFYCHGKSLRFRKNDINSILVLGTSIFVTTFIKINTIDQRKNNTRCNIKKMENHMKNVLLTSTKKQYDYTINKCSFFKTAKTARDFIT